MGLGIGIEEPYEEQDHFETDMIYIEDLFRRWQGITEDELIQHIINRKLQAYHSTKDMINTEGIRVHRIDPLRPFKYNRTNPVSPEEGIRIALTVSNVVFKLGDTAKFEFDKDYLTWRRGEPPVDPAQQPTNSKHSYKYACDRLSRRWRCNPKIVLTVLDNRREGALKYHPDIHIQGVARLADFYVMHNDLMRWERDNEANDFRPELKSATKAPQAELNALAKTAKATDAKQDKTANDWAECLEKAVALAVECANSGKQKSEKQHMEMWKMRWKDSKAAEPHRDAFRAFRKGLPPDLKHKSDAKA